jgi:large subunit ribosomal protein L9
MKVLLIKDIKSLGKAGEIKEVKDGYGQNFLIAKGMAKLATPQVIESWEAEKQRIAQELAEELSRLTEEKRALEAKRIVIEKPVAPVGIKGSVGNGDIAEAILAQFDITLDKKNINLKKAIKSTGTHEVDAKLGQGIHATLTVQVDGVE